ncbi:MAG: hypothetical protein CL917_12125 [Deltaproteobacteria bacterium]|nr:hypothetical protein [Deltaproteobacteria bacterium]
MYTAFYGLREKPFSLTPNPRFLYLTDAHREALAHLLYGFEEGEGFIVISGEVGTGKTTLCRSLLEKIELETEIAILFNPSENAFELLQSINEEFGLEVEGLSRRQLLGVLNRFLLDRNAAGQRVVLIVDEAQHLSTATLEQVRLLSNLETAANKLIQIILLGQPELDEKLDSNELRQLRQRVSVRWRLEPMNATETTQYIQHRLQVASDSPREIFTRAALLEIHRLTGGVPRLVNAVADRVLLAGFAAGQVRLGPSSVRKAAREIPGTRRAMASLGVTRGSLALAAALVASVLVGVALGPDVMPTTFREKVLVVNRSELDFDEPSVESRDFDELGMTSTETGAALEIPSSEEELVVVRSVEAEGVSFQREISVSALAVAPPRISPLLSGLLDDSNYRTSVSHAVRALTEKYGLGMQESQFTSVASAIAALREANLGITAFEGEDLTQLLGLNYPALIELRTDSGETRVVALVGHDGQSVEIAGLGKGDSVRLNSDVVADHFTGLAWIAWRPYLEIPSLIGSGERGAGVLWLQEALSRMEYGEVRITGTYDAATAAGVESFQELHGIRVDGLAGPFTQMLIYSELEEYQPPQLDDGEAG